ncbi:hypothetical protein HA42_06200 [Pantoea deleyi]|nr:citrate/2-methylcitrate synthase [Pantoea deleyi]ORM83478.1 hypothetical protein HA42_06200 [Pantoea deleyi]
MENDVLDRYDLDNNTLFIREENILQLAHSLHYLQNVWFTLSGEVLSLTEMDRRVAIASEALRQQERVARIASTWKSLQNVIQLDVIQRFMLLIMQSEPHVADTSYSCEADRLQHELTTVLLLPWLIELARNPQKICLLPTLSSCQAYSRWFSSTLSEYQPQENDISYMMSLLLGGFGIVAPTTATVRFIASTKNSLNYALIGALCAAGPAHLGACQRVTTLLSSLGDTLEQSVSAAAEVYCANRPWPGFGHPVMPRDTRVDAFFEHYTHGFGKYQALSEHISAQSGVNPNVDYLIGSACSRWHVAPEVAVLVFFVCRVPILLGHYRLRYHTHSFGMSSSELRDKYKALPKHWL